MNISSALYNPRVRKTTLLSQLKLGNYSQVRKDLKTAVSHPVVKKMVEKALSPKLVKNIRESKLLSYSGHFEGELAYLVNRILIDSQLISSFIQYEYEIELKISNSDESVFDTVNYVKQHFGYSLWLLQVEYLLIQLYQGTEANWTSLSDVSKELIDPVAQVLNSFFSKKVEPNLSILEYKRAIEAFIRPIHAGEAEYICFRVGDFLLSEIDEPAIIFFLESTSSAIDGYFTIISVLNDIITDVKNPHFAIAVQALEDLHQHIADPRLDRLLGLAGKAVFDAPHTPLTRSLEAYFLGDANEQIRILGKAIIETPYQFDVCALYAESLVDEGIEYKNLGFSAFTDGLLRSLFNLYSRGDNYEQAQEDLMRTCISYSQFNFAKQLLSILSSFSGRDVGKRSTLSDLYVFNRTVHPAISLRMQDSFMVNLKTDSNPVVDVYLNTRQSKIDALQSSGWNEQSIFPLVAQAYFNNGNFQNCLDFIEESLKKFDVGSTTMEQVVFLKFYCFINLGNYRAAITLCVDCYLKNRYSLAKLDIELLVNNVLDREAEMGDLIDLPILYYIHNLGDYYKYVALDNLLSSRGVSRPSSVLEEDSKTIFLLKNVCQIEVLTKFYLDYENYKEVVNERINILKRLIIIDKDNIDVYIEEVTKQNQREKIRSIIDTVNKGKIRLNIMSIKQNKDYNLENSFNRFLKLHDLSERKQIQIIDVDSSISSLINEIAIDSSKLQDASFLSFKSIWFEVVEYTLFSKEHGMDGDLSTGFRHGIIENQIRSVFIKNNIIAQRIDKNTYGEVSYWYEYTVNPLERIQKEWQVALGDFSKAIDGEIQSLISDFIQIKSNRHKDKKNGLFNYNFHDEQIWLLYKAVLSDANNFDDFLQTALLYLKSITESNLKIIRDYIMNSINSLFQNKLDELKEKATHLLNWGSFLSDVSLSIMNTKTQIANELEAMSDWFRLMDPNIDEALDMQSIVETSVELTNISYPHFNLHPTIECSAQTLFSGYRLFIDIFTILFTNIIEHSKLSPGELNVAVNILEQSINDSRDLLEIHVLNNLGSIVDVEALYNKLQFIKLSWAELDSSQASKEGGSGYPKIKRILTHTFSSLGNSFDFNLSSGNLEIVLTLDYAITRYE